MSRLAFSLEKIPGFPYRLIALISKPDLIIRPGVA
jgi:hypothetical protein